MLAAMAVATPLGGLSCVTGEAESELKITSEVTPAQADDDSTDALKRLEAATGTDAAKVQVVRDVHAMLTALDYAARGDQKRATEAWFTAAKQARSRFGEKALSGWIKAYVSALGRKSDPLVLARLILAETQDGRLIPYMIDKRLDTDAALIPLLQALVPEWLIVESSPDLRPLPPPAARGIPTDDPTLSKSAKISCGARAHQVAAWKDWVASLDEDVRAYWQALLAQCSGQTREALATLKKLYPKLAQRQTTQALAVEAASRAAVMQRALGNRVGAAETYLDLGRLWANPGVTSTTMGLEALAMSLRRIDELLWASRYRALIADYENAKIFADEAIKLIANAYTLRPGIGHNIREQLATLRAEAYHTLAYRIAVEKQEFESAVALTLLGLQSPNLNQEWTERLSWFAGFYEYLGGHYESAKKRWETLFNQVKDDAQRASIYFWLAKTYDRLDRREESRFYLDAIIEDYPLSYYAIVAPAVAGYVDYKDWRKVFGKPETLKDRLQRSRDFGIEKLRPMEPLATQLVRAEILVKARLTDWAKLALDELESTVNSELIVETNPGIYVYMSRMRYQIGDYLKAISLTTKVAKAVRGFWRQWPEQLLIYFPKPHKEIYDRNALDNAVDVELLLAISRQESGFTPDIRSSANAIGIMQLIRPTAERFATELSLPIDDLETQLRHPDFNIKLGSRYLRFLQLNYKGFPPAVYGGYNAGEFAVDLWLKRRGHSDPLAFVELIPFGETKDYVKNVWRNLMVYRFLQSGRDAARDASDSLLRWESRPRGPF